VGAALSWCRLNAQCWEATALVQVPETLGTLVEPASYGLVPLHDAAALELESDPENCALKVRVAVLAPASVVILKALIVKLEVARRRGGAALVLRKSTERSVRVGMRILDCGDAVACLGLVCELELWKPK
jgi:hypothetical protein